MDELDLNCFLKLGYFLRYAPDPWPVDLGEVDPGIHHGRSERELVAEGVALFRETVTSRFDPGRRHIVPISGGLDSRAILAVLRECTEAANLETYTFGTPGALDYELGNGVAALAGTRHTTYPLTNHRYTIDELREVARRIGGQTFLFHHPPLGPLMELCNGGVVWSGFIGDVFAGSHLPEQPSTSLRQAETRFLTHGRYVRSTELGNVSDTALTDLLDTPSVPAANITLDEQLVLSNRIRKGIAPHLLMHGFEYRVPFIDPRWIRFSLSLPPAHRRGLRLWKKVLRKLDPELFAYPTKSHHGLGLNAGPARVFATRAARRVRRAIVPQRGLDPNLNYLDFNDAFRTRDDLRVIVRESLAALAARGVVNWLDVEDVWNRHQRREGNFADALIVLTSLELNLQVAAENPGTALPRAPADRDEHRFIESTSSE